MRSPGKGWSAIALLALYILYDQIIRPVFNLNIERLAEREGLDTALQEQVPPGSLDSITDAALAALAFITGNFGLGFVIGAVIFAFWDPLVRHLHWPKSVTKQEGAVAPPPKTPPKKPKPIFGVPRQLAGEHYLSWWHIPISVEGDGGSPNAEIRHCTAELFFPSSSGDPIKLRWQSDADARGQEETELVEGMYRFVPIAMRSEPEILVDSHVDHWDFADGFARITGAAFLKDKDHDKFKLPKSQVKFRIRVRSGKKEWESPHDYLLNIPDGSHSNGHFTLSLIDG